MAKKVTCWDGTHSFYSLGIRESFTASGNVKIEGSTFICGNIALNG
jgi:hypothetical protein